MSEQPAPSTPAASAPAPSNAATDRVRFDLRNVGKATAVVLLIFSAAAFVQFVLQDAGSVIFTILMALALAITMEPAVVWLHRRGLKRGLATGLVMIAVIVGVALFFAAFGNLLFTQLAELLRGVPELARNGVEWLNQRFGTQIDIANIIGSIGLNPSDVAGWAAQVAGGIIAIVFGIVGSVFSVFTLGLFTFYLSADMPRLKRWIARMLPSRGQRLNEELWTVAVEKAGGYVGARLVLALINGSTTALFLYIIGMPYWLPLGIWTGIVAQFVPTIGTYIAIALPVIIGLLSDDPMDGILALGWAVAYQQVENLTIEPRISAKAVSLHPAVSFASVMFGAALFGAAGALLAVPVTAIVMAFVEVYAPRHELVGPPDADAPEPDVAPGQGTSEPAASAS